MATDKTFFTVVGCMDGRIQSAVAAYGQRVFDAMYPDTITDAGIVGILSDNPTKEYADALRTRLLISVNKHHSKGILVDGHEQCAGDPVDAAVQIDHIHKSVSVIRELVGKDIPVISVYVSPHESGVWEVAPVSEN